MSNEGIEDRTQRIVDEVSDVWILTDRDDLLDDCISYVEDNYAFSYEIKNLVIEYLSLKCADAMSTADLRAMSAIDNMQYEDGSEPLTYEEVTSGE
jgi:hypothetical protein